MKRSIAIALSAVMISTTLLSAGCGRKNSNTSNNNNGHIGGSDTSGRNDGIMGEIFDTDGSMGDNNSGDSHSTETTSMPPGETTSDTEKNPAMIKPQGFEDLDFGGKTFVIATQSGTDARSIRMSPAQLARLSENEIRSLSYFTTARSKSMIPRIRTVLPWRKSPRINTQ